MKEETHPDEKETHQKPVPDSNKENMNSNIIPEQQTTQKTTEDKKEENDFATIMNYEPYLVPTVFFQKA